MEEMDNFPYNLLFIVPIYTLLQILFGEYSVRFKIISIKLRIVVGESI